MACRLALLELERRGEVVLPARRSGVRTPHVGAALGGDSRTGSCAAIWRSWARSTGRRASAREDRDLSDLWNDLIAGYHYLGYTPLVGAQQRYLIESEHHGCLGALGFSAAARRVAARDRWIGWSDQARAEHSASGGVQLALSDSAVGSRAQPGLARAGVGGAAAWRRTGSDATATSRCVLESFVEQERFTGVSYRAANWVEVGTDQGARSPGSRPCLRRDQEEGVRLSALREHWRERLGVVARRAPADWAEREFGSARFGDRATVRGGLCPSRVISTVGHRRTFPRPATAMRAKVKAVYRFMDNEEVTLAKLLEPHQEQTLKRMAEHKVVLAVQDSTSLNYTAHALTEGTGPIGTEASGALGLIVHDTVAVTPEGLALGVIDAQVWARDWEDKEAGRPIEQKESVKWLRSYQVGGRAAGRAQEDPRGQRRGPRGRHLRAVRHRPRAHRGRRAAPAGACHRDRCLAETSKKLWENVEAQPVAGYREIVVPPRPGRKARTATLSVRFCEVVLDAPQGKRALGTIRLWAVHARERRAPSGTEAVEWMLLTTMEVRSFEQACEKLDWYTRRWMIEVFHRTLKSGCRIEDRQLGTVPRIENCLAIDMMVAVRIMHLTWLSRTHPHLPCTMYFEDNQWKALSCFLTRKRVPQKKVPTMQEMVGWIGKLGGHLGRKCDGPPGTQTLWEGIQRTDDIVAAMTIHATFAQGP